jgi:hypothetical protein
MAGRKARPTECERIDYFLQASLQALASSLRFFFAASSVPAALTQSFFLALQSFLQGGPKGLSGN